MNTRVHRVPATHSYALTNEHSFLQDTHNGSLFHRRDFYGVSRMLQISFGQSRQMVTGIEFDESRIELEGISKLQSTEIIFIFVLFFFRAKEKGILRLESFVLEGFLVSGETSIFKVFPDAIFRHNT